MTLRNSVGIIPRSYAPPGALEINNDEYIPGSNRSHYNADMDTVVCYT